MKSTVCGACEESTRQAGTQDADTAAVIRAPKTKVMIKKNAGSIIPVFMLSLLNRRAKSDAKTLEKIYDKRERKLQTENC